MKLEVTWDIWKLMQLNDKINASVQIILTDVWLFISNKAKENAPYLTWALRRSISNDFNTISKWFVVVGSPLSYASVREFSNRKHPDRKYYLERSFTQHVWDIMDIIMEDLDYKLKE
jgi:hypothetical protein